MKAFWFGPCVLGLVVVVSHPLRAQVERVSSFGKYRGYTEDKYDSFAWVRLMFLLA